MESREGDCADASVRIELRPQELPGDERAVTGMAAGPDRNQGTLKSSELTYLTIIMRFGDLEKEIESKLIPLFRTCEKYLQRILSAVRGLLNLRVAATICSMKLSELRQRLQTILVSELWVKKIHRVSFDEECTYSLFWTPVLNCVTDEDAPVLFRRKLCGTIVPVCNEAARKKFDCEGPLLMKSLGRFSFLYIEFEPEQVLLKVQDYCRRLQLLRCIFRVVEIEDV